MENEKLKKVSIFIGIIAILSIFAVAMTKSMRKEEKEKTKELTATVMSIENDKVTVQDMNNIIYTFGIKDIQASVGENINIKYTGELNVSKDYQDNDIIDYSKSARSVDENGIPNDWKDNGIFSNYYILANNKLKSMTLEEKIAQLLLVRYPGTGAEEVLKKYSFGGYVFFEKDFKDKTEQQVKNMMSSLQKVAKTPILTAVDEEGGKVVRVSSNPNLASEKFASSKDLYAKGGLDAIRVDTINKSNVLANLGINLNLAPVVDVSTNSTDYMYDRTIGENTQITSNFSKTVIEASKNRGVSYTLKHFPGYGNNPDTHTTGTTDNRTYDEIKNNDLPPFKAGIEAGAEAVLVSHNTVTNIDDKNPASLSPAVHNLLRKELSFTGVIITDDLAMGAVSSIPNASVKAILAGNDILITTDYEESMKQIKTAVENGDIDESLINKLAFRVLSWKYAKGMMMVNQK